MELVEIRDLDGPNLFLLEPAIKIELIGEPDAGARARLAAALGDLPNHETASANDSADSWAQAESLILALHRVCGAPAPQTMTGPMEAPGHHVVAFTWQRRAFARKLARTVAGVLTNEQGDLAATIPALRELLSRVDDGEDHPEEIRDRERRLPIIAITGTNGKTTTTRLAASMLRRSGRRVGWTSSAGVFIEGQAVLEGDYTGPAGAHRVFEEPDLDIAVLETARGGILLRGLGYESNDVGVVTNISGDHLGLQGVYTVEGLARVKEVVVRVTKPDGYAVLNADDPLVLEMRSHLRARPLLISRRADNDAVMAHVGAGGAALFVRDEAMIWTRDGHEELLIPLAEVPITFNGRAAHMVENALCAAAACLGFGLRPEQVRDGLRTFRNRSDQNRGRLNIYELDGYTVIVDFAHNEAGLRHLLGLAHSFLNGDGRVISLVGTAGDRDDASLRGLGRLSGNVADVTIIKDSTRYLRGRQTGDIPRLIAEGYRESDRHGEMETSPSELDAFHRATDIAHKGDVIAMMCVEDYNDILAFLEQRGRALS